MDGMDQPAELLALLRDLARRAHPDAVAELIDGATAEEIQASIEPARAVYARLRAELASPAVQPEPVTVPAGGMAPVPDPDHLPAAEKIRRGLATAMSRRG